MTNAKLLTNLIKLPLLALILTNCADREQSHRDKISFNASIRPILNKNCVGCHGGVTKQGGISYIYRDQAITRGNSGRLNIVPNHAAASELIQRIKSADPTRRMPYKRPALSEEDIALLERWIDQGAQWEAHWAFIPPKPISPPAVKTENQNWLTSPIDAFVLSKMQPLGFAPNRPAEPAEWLRRVSLDLIGLPPSETEVLAFLENPNEAAYENAVDRLLASPAFGERWASVWLDIARYSDSRGYERDRHRDAWPYRDWLVEAFNQNMPYDDFVTKQLAGDLLPNPSQADYIATTFHRLTAANDEAGTDDEEYRTYAVMDRNATTWGALNGITMNCVQCHAHPYDPITHEEYFRSLAFFNTTEDADRRSDGPHLKVAFNAEENKQIFAWQQALENNKAQLLSETTRWHAQGEWTPLKLEHAYIDESLVQNDTAELTWLSLDTTTREKTAECHWNKNSALQDFCQNEYTARTKDIYSHYLDTLISDSQKNTETIPLNIDDGELREPKLGIPAFANYQLITEANTGNARKLAAIKLTSLPLKPKEAIHSPRDGFTLERIKAEIIRQAGSKTPIHIDYFSPGSVYGYEQMLKLYGRRQQKNIRLGAEWYTGFTAHLHGHPVTTTAILKEAIVLQKGDRIRFSLSQLQRDHPRGEKPYYFRHLKLAASENLSPAPSKKIIADSQALTVKINTIKSANVPVMREQIALEARSTRVFHRGNFADKKDRDISPSTPEIFPVPFRSYEGTGNNGTGNNKPRATRLDLAQWFFHEKQPLTARVAVNRLWAQLFGEGIVSTQGDFGSIGAAPSHPELLDWLARYYQHALHWNTKALLKTLALSATYRQSAQASPEEIEKDPKNIYLARGPYQRLTAEMVRDQALFAAGLLSDKRGGISVMPPQPPGVWQTVYNKDRWVEASDEDRYRRALYTYHKRTAPYPSMTLFDDAGHIVSAAQRMVTNTPLQALVTLNDIVYHEAAQSLGQILFETATSASVEKAIHQGFLRVLSRHGTVDEQTILLATIKKTSAHGNQAKPWTQVAAILLNLDASLKR